MLDFHNGMRLWAQYAVGNEAVHEWVIYSEDVSVEISGGVATLTMVSPRSRREFAG